MKRELLCLITVLASVDISVAQQRELSERAGADKCGALGTEVSTLGQQLDRVRQELAEKHVEQLPRTGLHAPVLPIWYLGPRSSPLES